MHGLAPHGFTPPDELQESLVPSDNTPSGAAGPSQAVYPYPFVASLCHLCPQRWFTTPGTLSDRFSYRPSFNLIVGQRVTLLAAQVIHHLLGVSHLLPVCPLADFKVGAGLPSTVMPVIQLNAKMSDWLLRQALAQVLGQRRRTCCWFSGTSSLLFGCRQQWVTLHL